MALELQIIRASESIRVGPEEKLDRVPIDRGRWTVPFARVELLLSFCHPHATFIAMR